MVSAGWVAPKPEPEIVNVVPGQTLVGDTLLMPVASDVAMLPAYLPSSSTAPTTPAKQLRLMKSPIVSSHSGIAGGGSSNGLPPARVWRCSRLAGSVETPASTSFWARSSVMSRPVMPRARAPATM